MKKLLSIILALALVMGTLLLMSCSESKQKEIDLGGQNSDESDPNKEQNKEENKEQDGEQNPNGSLDDSTDTPPANNPVLVETLNGKSAKELYKSFIAEYTNTTNYNISIETNVTIEGTQINSFVNIKTNENAVYVKIDNLLENMEFWFFSNATYLKASDYKYKIPNAGIDHFLGEGFVEMTLSSVLSGEEQKTYLEKLNDVSLYSLNGEYYFQVEFTDKEAEDAGLGPEGFLETVFFNEQGKVKRIVDSSEAESTTVTLSAYGNFVSIFLPPDASQYYDYYIPEDELKPPFNENAGDQDPRAYAKYQEIFDTLKDAYTFYIAVASQDGSYTYMDYLFVGNSEFVHIWEDGNYYDRYYINKKGYEGPFGDQVSQVEVTDEFLSHFELARSIKQKICNMQLHGNDMKDFTITSNNSDKVFTFSHDLGDGLIDYYEISVFYIDNAISSVIFSVRHTLNGEDVETEKYDCIQINDHYAEIILPSIR